MIQFKNAMNEGPIKARSGSHVMVCVWIADLHASLLFFQKAFETIKEGSIPRNLQFFVLICLYFCQMI